MKRLRMPYAVLATCLGLCTSCGSEDRVLEGDELPSTTGGPDSGLDASNDASAHTPDAQRPTAADAAPEPQAVASAADCDLNGFWIARQQTVNVALGLPQTANNWYYYELRHEGDSFEVVDHFDCGIEVLGTVHVQMMPNTVQSLIPHNLQRGRSGTMTKTADGHCTFKIDRFWSVRGMSEATYAPADRFTQASLSDLATSRPLPTKMNPQGAEDWDGDGELGIAWYITGLARGTRHSIQRDFTEWFSDAEFQITPSTTWSSDFVVRSTIGSEEVVLSATDPTLAGSGTPDGSAKHRVTFHFLGRDRATANQQGILEAKPLDTCAAIRDALPSGTL